MIEAEAFVEAARQLGFIHYTGVPCSFLTPFINYVINDDQLEYISSANEGDALATAAGTAIGGKRSIVMMQNSGLGNAVSPLTSLAWVFQIPVLIISTHRGAPGVNDEPQHELMGKITGDMFDIMQVPWEPFPDKHDKILPALKRAQEHMQKNNRPYAFIMQKGTVSPHPLKKRSIPETTYRKSEKTSYETGTENLTRNEVLRQIINHTPEDEYVVIATTGYTGRELFAINDRVNQLYMVGSMGCASAWGLGLSLARPDLKVVIIDGDGAALMRMGNFATLGTYGQSNLIHLLLDNGVHDSTGAQATVSCNVKFADIANACGYAVTYEGNDLKLVDDLFTGETDKGPRFGHLKIKPGTMDNLPRPDKKPAEVLRRLMQHINSSF